MRQPRALVGRGFPSLLLLLRLFYIYSLPFIPPPSPHIPVLNRETITIQMQSLTMKAFLSQANPQSLSSLLPPFGTNQSQGFKPSNLKLVRRRNRDDGFAVGCASWSLEAELQRELEAEMKQNREGGGGGEEKQRIGMARFRHKCKEGKGVVDLLECLEREAIMGEDVGKEPLDYNRRAQIFDRSSRVFQALRQNDDSVSSSSSSSPQQSSK